ncbi:hypothetical protein HMPREF3227_02235 [Corynebacterium sp. CMW7794]|nr:hypothetical protein HMPREF3227_02235 [Corynebacterium sp. CMW7794]
MAGLAERTDELFVIMSRTSGSSRTRTHAGAALSVLAACGLLAGCGVGDGSDEGLTDPTAVTTTGATQWEPSLGIPASSPLAGPEPGESKTINLPSGRTFILHVPENYDPSRAWPVVLSFHGWGETASQMEAYTRFDSSEAIVAYAQGTDKAWAPAPYAKTSGAEDVAFVQQIVDSLRATYAVDDERIYAVGMSNGGGFAAYLACQMPEYFHAVASVSAAYYSKIHDGCKSAAESENEHYGEPLPVGRLDLHGTDDPIVSYFGGTRHGATYNPVMEVLAMDQKRNQCSDQISTSRLASNSLLMQWKGCRAPLVHIRIGGGNHVWPGGSYDKSHVLPEGFATDAVLDFFAIPGRATGTEDSANKL